MTLGSHAAAVARPPASGERVTIKRNCSSASPGNGNQRIRSNSSLSSGSGADEQAGAPRRGDGCRAASS